MADANSSKDTGVHFDTRKGRYRVQFKITSNGGRVRRSRLLPKDITLEEAQSIAEGMKASALRELCGIEPKLGWVQIVDRAMASKASWLHEIYRRARQRARARNRVFALTLDELRDLLVRSGGKCEVTGIAFSQCVVGGARMRPLVPSLDRRDATAGYVKENCRIVCAAINVAMFTWGEQMFKNLALGYLINQVIAPHAEIFQVRMPSHLIPVIDDELTVTH